MKMTYTRPEAEIVSFQAMEQLATGVDINLSELPGSMGVGSRDF